MSLLFRCMRTRHLLCNGSIKLLAPTTQIRVSSSSTPPPNQDKKEPKEYIVKFQRGMDVKKVFKEVYSLYGPLFVGCHIGVSLISLGFFSSLVWFSVDLDKIIPDSIAEMAGKAVVDMTGGGGKFVLAYAIHKVILPFRLTAAILLTRFLSLRIKRARK